VNCAEISEPINLPFGLWTRVGRRKHKFNHICQVAPLCPHGRAYWRHPANTIEPSVCGGDAVLCEITLTTCLLCFYIMLLWPPCIADADIIFLPCDFYLSSFFVLLSLFSSPNLSGRRLHVYHTATQCKFRMHV